MLNVIPTSQALELALGRFGAHRVWTETAPLRDALGRRLAVDIISSEYVPAFNRSTVDGYAVRAADTFGCSESLPAILAPDGEIRMGRGAGGPLTTACCRAIPTGGELPEGADAVVMQEFTEKFSPNELGILKPVAPGGGVIYKGDDVFPGKTVLKAGRRLLSADIGALAALGVTAVEVYIKPRVAILSTGDELVPVGERPGPGQVRDVNSALLAAAVEAAGGEPLLYGVIPDDERVLTTVVWRAADECDMVLLSGGSSVGEKDAAARVIASLGKVLFHGLAMKPGKPTLLGEISCKPVFGLPGHPVAAYFAARVLALPLLAAMMGGETSYRGVRAELAENLSSNHGREEYVPVTLSGGFARPVRTKSGLITSLADTDGYIVVPRDREGLAAGAPVDVYLW